MNNNQKKQYKSMLKLVQHDKTRGFTLIELVVALATLAVIGVVTTGMLFSALTWGDRVRALEEVEESSRILERTLRRAVLSAIIMTESPEGSLLLTGADECWTFAYSSSQGRVNYSHIEAGGCVPDTNPVTSLLPEDVTVSNLDFSFTDFTTGGRQLKVVATIEREYPLGGYSREIELTIMNYLINEL